MEISERLKSKNWKERQEVYLELGTHFREGRHLEHLYLLQNETNIPALESAIDAILKAPIISTKHVSKIFLQIGNNKTSIKNRIFTLIDNIKDGDLIPTLVTFLSNKNPKIVSNVIICLNNRKLNVCQELLESLDIILNHSDNIVRSEAMKLAVSIYKIIGNDIRKYLNIKPILLKELEEEFDKISPKEKQKPKELDLSNIDDPKWTIRLEILTNILNSKTISNNILDLICNRINDPNNQVFFTLLDIVNKFRINNNKIINGLIERLKDKKLAITKKIKVTLISLNIKQINPQYFKSKSPELKSNLIEICQKCQIVDLDVIKGIILCAEDSNGQVRSKAIEALSVLEFNRNILSKDIIKRIESNKQDLNKNNEYVIKSLNEVNVNINESKLDIKDNIKNKTEHIVVTDLDKVNSSKTTFKNDNLNTISYNKDNFKNNIDLINQRSNYNKKGQPQYSKEIVEIFCEKYAFLKEKMWTIRLEGIKTNTNSLLQEDLIDFAYFLYNVRDANFQVNILYIDILIARKQQICKNFVVQEILIYYCVDKCTEIKLRNRILDFLNVCNRYLVLDILIEEICKIKKGKKFIELVKILSVYHRNEQEIQKIINIQVTGIQEKKVIEDLKSSMSKDNCNINEVLNKNESLIELDTSKSSLVRNDVTCNGIQDFSESNNSFKNINSNNDSIKDNSSHINESVDIKNDNSIIKDINNIPEVINYYISKDKQSTFFNSLLVQCIVKKYILSEKDCIKLLTHFISKGFHEEFSMIDRVYPVTRLFLLLKDVFNDQSEDLIISILQKYVNTSEKEKIIRNIQESDDFLDFVDKFNGNFIKFNNKTFSTPVKNKYNDYFNKDTTMIDTNILSCNNKDQNTFTFKDHKKYINTFSSNNKDTNIFDHNKDTNKLIAPTVFEDVINLDLEASIDCLKLTPDIKKFRKDFLSPKKNIDDLEDILDNIIDSDQIKSEKAFRRLLEIIKTDINSILFSANSIISSISIQLLDVINRPDYAKLILNVLLKISQNKTFCDHIRKETLESVNIDLINILRNEEISDIVSDILTNLCLNCRMSQNIEVYLNLLNKPFLVKNEIPLKLIWRHSKSLDMKNKEEVQKMLHIFEEFYKKSLYFNLLENITTFKISILHIREICIFYQDNVYKFNLGINVQRIVEKILNDQEITIQSIRNN